MTAAPIFDYERSDISRVYAAARALPSAATDVWRTEIAAIVAAARSSVANVIDAGCGTGRFSAMLAEIFHAGVLGIDPAPKMLDQARASVSDPRCTFAPGFIEALPTAAASADLVFLSMVFHHVRDWSAALSELHRVLRPGGLAVVRTALRETLPQYLWTRFFPGALAIDQGRLPSAKDVVARLTSGGFSFVERRTVVHRFADDAESYLAKIRLRGLSGLQLITDTAFMQGRAALENYLHTTPTDTSSFTEEMDLFCFVRPAD